jgi:endonuclease/exonuclease/phosphatase family metal-dependent hydrolase
VKIRVMTYNIRGGLGADGRRSIERVAETIHSARPDVVCLQEVHQRLPWSRMADQPRALARLLGCRVTFQRNLSLGFGGEGLAIATRYPVLSVRRHRLPGRGERRGALQVVLCTPLGTVTFVCTHWGLGQTDRDRQATCVADRLRAVAGPLVVAGDLNATAGDACVARLLAGAGLTDTHSGHLTYSVAAPTVRIDYVLHSRHLTAGGVATLPTGASDHYPVVSEMALAIPG